MSFMHSPIQGNLSLSNLRRAKPSWKKQKQQCYTYSESLEGDKAQLKETVHFSPLWEKTCGKCSPLSVKTSWGRWQIHNMILVMLYWSKHTVIMKIIQDTEVFQTGYKDEVLNYRTALNKSVNRFGINRNLIDQTTVRGDPIPRDPTPRCHIGWWKDVTTCHTLKVLLLGVFV